MTWNSPAPEYRHNPRPAVRLVSVSQTVAPCPLRQLELYADFAGKVYWYDPITQHEFLGLGTASTLMSLTADRFAIIEQQARHLFAGAAVSGPGNGPRLLGGFAFTPHYLSDRIWQSFLPSCFILPHFQLECRDGHYTVTINVLADMHEDPTAIQQHCTEALAHFCQSCLPGTPEPSQAYPAGMDREVDIRISEPVPAPAWQTAVRKALARIQDGQARKVVLANIRELRTACGFDLSQALQALLRQYPACYVFLFQRDADAAFLGASPELLCTVADSALTSMALAGTAPRDRTDPLDARSQRALMQSDKNRHEHQIVVDIIASTLQRHKVAVEFSAVPQVLSLQNVHHLQTPIRGHCTETHSAIHWAGILHPTPALGGEPRAGAMDLIHELECQPRGWYGAPFGIVDSCLNGTFVTAIRSGVVHGPRAWLFAGAGIVEGSVPHLEWAELGWKFQPLQEALTCAAHPVPTP